MCITQTIAGQENGITARLVAPPSGKEPQWVSKYHDFPNSLPRAGCSESQVSMMWWSANLSWMDSYRVSCNLQSWAECTGSTSLPFSSFWKMDFWKGEDASLAYLTTTSRSSYWKWTELIWSKGIRRLYLHIIYKNLLKVIWKVNWSTWHKRGTKKKLIPRQESNQGDRRSHRE